MSFVLIYTSVTHCLVFLDFTISLFLLFTPAPLLVMYSSYLAVLSHTKISGPGGPALLDPYGVLSLESSSSQNSYQQLSVFPFSSFSVFSAFLAHAASSEFTYPSCSHCPQRLFSQVDDYLSYHRHVCLSQYQNTHVLMSLNLHRCRKWSGSL